MNQQSLFHFLTRFGNFLDQKRAASAGAVQALLREASEEAQLGEETFRRNRNGGDDPLVEPSRSDLRHSMADSGPTVLIVAGSTLREQAKSALDEFRQRIDCRAWR